MDFVGILIGGLATWRVSHMLVKEDGPLDIFARIRASLGKRQKKRGGLFDLMSCVSCTSMYIGALAALWLAGSVVEIIMYTLAFSAFTALVERFTR